MSSLATEHQDPIARARANWVRQGWEDAADPMAAVTSVVRVQQILLGRANDALKPFGLTFSRFELLALLNFSRERRMLMSRASRLLQVHATSVTHAADRLEKDGLLARRPVDGDRRALMLELTAEGRRVVEQAADALNAEVFTDLGITAEQSRQLFEILRVLRARAGDV